ncbi:MAG TPA: insulinase family protein, partial [Polyangiaceae bacterium]
KPSALDHRAAGQADPSAAPLASVMPAVEASPHPHIPVAKEAQLKNGVRVLVLPDAAFPLAAVAVVVTRGSNDAAPGVFSLFMDSVISGNDLIAPKALRRNLNEYAVDHQRDVRREYSSAEWQFVSTLLGDVVRMTVTSFATPAFDSEAFDVLLDEHKRELSRQQTTPASAARRELNNLLFTSHPETADSARLDGVTLDTVKALKPVLGADDVVVVATGDVSEEKLMPLLETALGSMPKLARAKDPEADGAGPSGSRVLVLDHPGDSQAQIALAFMGTKWDDADFASLYLLANVIENGAYGALRISHGLTYGVSASIALSQTPAPLVLTAAVDATRVHSALEDVKKTIANAQSTNVDLPRVKGRVIASLAGGYDTVTRSARKLEVLAGLRLPADAWSKLADAIDKVTPDDLARVAKKYLDASRAQLVILGDEKYFRGDLDALGFGQAEVRKAPH